MMHMDVHIFHSSRRIFVSFRVGVRMVPQYVASTFTHGWIYKGAWGQIKYFLLFLFFKNKNNFYFLKIKIISCHPYSAALVLHAMVLFIKKKKASINTLSTAEYKLNMNSKTEFIA